MQAYERGDFESTLVIKFYRAVLDDFIRRLEHQIKFRGTLTSKQVHKIREIMLKKVCGPDEFPILFKKNLPSIIPKNLEQTQIQQQYVEQDHEQLAKKKEQNEKKKDLEMFGIKKEEVYSIVNQQAKRAAEDEEEDKNEDDISNGESKNKLTNEIIWDKTCGHITATYKNKKHIPKEEKTRIQLQNVFVKMIQAKTECFYPKMYCTFTTINEEELNDNDFKN